MQHEPLLFPKRQSIQLIPVTSLRSMNVIEPDERILRLDKIIAFFKKVQKTTAKRMKAAYRTPALRN